MTLRDVFSGVYEAHVNDYNRALEDAAELLRQSELNREFLMLAIEIGYIEACAQWILRLKETNNDDHRE